MDTIGLALRLVSFGRWQAILTRLAPIPAAAPEPGLSASPVLAEMTARMVRAAAARGPYRAACLPRALTTWWLLRRRGLESEIRFGVRRPEGRRPAGRLEAHAWVVFRGQAMDDGPGGVQSFAPLERRTGPVDTEAR